MGRDMNGVVLWSNESQQKAVIWCEDQGDLAFYSQGQCQALVDLHVGDLICFDLMLHQNRRMIENPLVLKEAASMGLAERLIMAQPRDVANLRPVQNSAQVIPFNPNF
ncbi:hypothetical protein DL239_15415 [Sedimentitalea sp. CY04]|uniref:Uncharacterized protein n=2 Tax=Parasedimentitalea denitrificans TaxID=2211118 RepID=A0ABX0WCE9_9RHOB|nr:hypothetical protein [Sedimentitalea sp. CY04]